MMNQNRFRLRVVRLLLLWLLLLPATTLAASSAHGIPVLLYHHVSDAATDMPMLTLPTKEFERQLGLLRTAGFQTITPGQLLAFMRGERQALPDRPILLTFDDGYTDNYTQAFPILKATAYSATIFMVGINFDRTNRLSSSQINEMVASNLSIGAHSMTHPNLTKLSAPELRYEVTGSKTKAERVIGLAVDFFAYPSGFYDVATVEAVEAAGYLGAFSVLPGLNQPARDNVYLLRRIPIYRTTNFDRLLARLINPPSIPSLLDW